MGFGASLTIVCGKGSIYDFLKSDMQWWFFVVFLKSIGGMLTTCFTFQTSVSRRAFALWWLSCACEVGHFVQCVLEAVERGQRGHSSIVFNLLQRTQKETECRQTTWMDEGKPQAPSRLHTTFLLSRSQNAPLGTSLSCSVSLMDTFMTNASAYR